MKQPTTKLFIALIIVAILAIGSLAMYVNLTKNSTQSTETETSKTQPAAAPETGRTEITYRATPGITSLEQLRQEARDVVVTESEYGELVDSIEGHKGGTDGKYWSFYVNGQMAEVGAGSYIQKEGDTVTWKFQKL